MGRKIVVVGALVVLALAVLVWRRPLAGGKDEAAGRSTSGVSGSGAAEAEARARRGSRRGDGSQLGGRTAEHRRRSGRRRGGESPGSRRDGGSGLSGEKERSRGATTAADAAGPVAGAARNFDLLEEEDGVYLDDDSVLSLPAEGRIGADGGTIDMLIEPSWDGVERTSNSILSVGEPHEKRNRLTIVKNVNDLRFLLFDDDGAEHDVSVSILDWVAGERHQITATWGDAEMKLYVDGRLAGRQRYSGRFIPGARARIRVGSRTGAKLAGANARILDLGVFDTALEPGEL